MSNLVLPSIVWVPSVVYSTVENYLYERIWSAHESGKSVISLNALLDHLCQIPRTYDERGNLLMGHFFMTRSEEAPTMALA